MFTSRFGCCEVLISDQGREFVNEVQEELFRLTGTEHCVTSACNPNAIDKKLSIYQWTPEPCFGKGASVSTLPKSSCANPSHW